LLAGRPCPSSEAGPTGELAFICGAKGKPLSKESFGNLFKKACKQAGLPNRSAHGLRKIAATRAAENGATVAQLEAIFGWKGGRMASLYTETASRKRLALDAMHTLANEKGKSVPPPSGKVQWLWQSGHLTKPMIGQAKLYTTP